MTGFGPHGTIANYPGDPWIDPIKYTSYRGSGWGGHFMQGGTPVYDGSGMKGILDTMLAEYRYLHPKGVHYELFIPDVWSAWELVQTSHAQPGDPQGHDYSKGHPAYNVVKNWTIGSFDWNSYIDTLIKNHLTEGRGGGVKGRPSKAGLETDNYDWEYYIDFCTRLAEFVCDNNMCDKFDYDLWNEPDLGKWTIYHSVDTIMWRRTKQQYFEMWKIGVRTIRKVHETKGKPAARIAGPSYGYNDENGIREFIQMAIASNTVPDVITMHALDGDPVELVKLFKRTLKEFGVDPSTKEMYVQEYAKPESMNPGNIAWYLARCERAGARGSLAVWGQMHTDVHPDWAMWVGQSGELNGILRIGPKLNDAGRPLYRPTGLWWVYKKYADITGKLYATTASPAAATDILAGADEQKREARMLLGRHYGLPRDPNKATQVGIHITGLDRYPYLLTGNSVRVTIQKIPFNNDQANAKPEHRNNLSGIVLEQNIETSTRQYISIRHGGIDITINWDNNQDAYVIILGRQKN
ncbi:MAG: hypothetical protein FWD61_17910 [Phycisphaerales bacterium]|nr:hypothetical protein [Phycisphaerales bacterium]